MTRRRRRRRSDQVELSAPLELRLNEQDQRTVKMVAAAQPAAKWAPFVVVFASIVVVILATHAPAPHLAAVIRPTIFSDLPPEAAGQPTAAVAAKTAPQQQQQQAQQAIAQQQQQSSHYHRPTEYAQMSSNLNNGTQGQTQAQTQSQAGNQAPKINPLKSRFCSNPTGHRLDHSLGLQSFAIDDLSLSASSYSNEQVRPHLARLNLDILGGAWCPMKPISASNFGKEWIQVKLNRSFVVSAIETQGRFALGSGKEFVPSYQVEYSRNNGLTWHKWKDFRGSSLLRANDDVQTAVRNELSPPIVGANVIRILPYSQYLRTVCMRFELYGCHYDEGAPISYTTSDGVVEPRWGHLIDYTYDGLRHRSGQLSGGLGQLVDGVRGPDNFQFNNGFEWVGWKSMNGDVVIEFTFKTLRNFTGALFHSNNLFSSGVEVFQGVDVHYGIDVALSTEALRDALWERKRRHDGGALARSARQLGDVQSDDATTVMTQQQPATMWSTSEVQSLEYEPDKKVESSRPVTVHLKQRLANKLRFVLKFASKWILISEVEFLSHPVELMSLASLNDQLTPKLIGDLQLAKTYDQYVAILREHQLRRIAADEFQLNMANSALSTYAPGTSDTSDPPTPPTQSDEQDNSLQQQQQQQQQQANNNNNNNNNDATMLTHFQDLPPATNPMLSQPPATPIQLSPFATGSEPSSVQQPVELLFNGNQQQQQEKTLLAGSDANLGRTYGLATVIAFVFVGILALLGFLLVVSSYRLRQAAHPKLGCGTPARHAFGSPASVVVSQHQQHNPKSLMGNVFNTLTATNQSAAIPTNQSSSNSSTSSQSNTIGYARHHQMATAARNHLLLDQQHNAYNPLFATSSGRSSDGDNSLRKSSTGGAALSTLKRLAQLTSGGASATKQQRHFGGGGNTNQLMFGQVGGGGQAQNQLLVSLKDSSQGKSLNEQTINTQLIVGLNQVNPLAHQQIYNNAQIYGQAAALNDYHSLATSSSNAGDYATPDLQPIIQQTRAFPPMTGNELRNSSRQLQANRQQQLIMQPRQPMENNYEQISENCDSQSMAPSMLHNRTFSGGAANHCFNPLTMTAATTHRHLTTSGNQQPAGNEQQQQQQVSHYYYADTEAAKSCAR